MARLYQTVVRRLNIYGHRERGSDVIWGDHLGIGWDFGLATGEPAAGPRLG